MAETKWKFEPTQRWVRVKFGGEFIADSRDAMLMHESSYQLDYYFPKRDVRMELLEKSDHTETSGYKGERIFWHVKVGDQVAENAAWTYKDKEGRPELEDYIAFDWGAMDNWYEENEEIIGHPRNPYHRVDVVRSTRQIRVEVDGQVIAESDRPVVLFETHLPARYYIPKDDVNMDYLTPSDIETICPYKGVADDYYHVTVNGTTHENIVWGYKDPFDAVLKIKDMLAFYNEKVDIYVDGELENRPHTVFA